MKITIPSECTPTEVQCWEPISEMLTGKWFDDYCVQTRTERLSNAVAELEQPFKLAVMAYIDCNYAGLQEVADWLATQCEWRYVLKANFTDDWRYTLLIGFEHEADAIKCRLSGFELKPIEL